MKSKVFQIGALAVGVVALLIAGWAFNRPHEGTTISTTFSEEKVKFCITGDTGMNTATQREIADLIKKEKCDRVVIVGDLVYPRGIASPDDPQVKQKFDDYYYPLTQIDKKPKVALINGNHDYRGNYRAWIDLAQRRDWMLMPNRYWAENANGFCFLYLDSTIFAKAAHRWDILPQVQWIREVREKNSKSCHTEIVFSHHPYLSVGRHANASGFEKRLYDWLFIDRSDFFISGHAHLAKDFGAIGKTQLLISGAGGQVERGHQGGLLVLEMNTKNRSVSYHFTNTEPINPHIK